MRWFCLVCRQDRECKRISTRPVRSTFWSMNAPPALGIQHRTRRWECTTCGLRFNTHDILDEDSVRRGAA